MTISGEIQQAIAPMRDDLIAARKRIEELEKELAEWKDRYEAERYDHSDT